MDSDGDSLACHRRTGQDEEPRLSSWRQTAGGRLVKHWTMFIGYNKSVKPDCQSTFLSPERPDSSSLTLVSGLPASFANFLLRKISIGCLRSD